ncbi:polyribonucleotide nucleotidyltransferase [Helicobacter suis]|uniref:Polyribonucleotide nucleotidyltransferase n=2 Tax=Helicobacter suis TaxID=104628 RepID=E7G3F0_9HELI|nr:polyribonucleotide nucleotidyltransferase [Helicobacter suis]EFX42084.1 polynucleotide phosphorylase/polyadenylase [Helicobacter suis HS5]EFX43230.1 polynucleotide phosphorylase/polyadenylase [Helicobacter suis HS1]BCD45708.1 Polyribonucleotide nucleotidyltransferase Pnp [Helicobacter suis]BCD48366.1 Polyribonucleotide nucleotidyltransferase Pnp [Helicobacter suis]BCD50142.1 Polyribonucleotide nucleotidyltransferase Pnp [Helicobacter suis]
MQNIEINGQEFKIDYVAKTADSALLYRYKGTVILASVVVDRQHTEADFLPLSVQYAQRAYAVGRFPSNFLRREGKMDNFETLTSRLIDRSLRPLFPKGYTYPTQITLLVLSYDYQSDLQVCALNAASNALYLANIGVDTTIHAMRLNGTDTAKSLDLLVVGNAEAILMIEMQIKDSSQHALEESKLLDLIRHAHTQIQEYCMHYYHHFTPHRKPKNLSMKDPIKPNTALIDLLNSRFKAIILETSSLMARSERNAQVQDLIQKIAEELNLEGQQVSLEELKLALQTCLYAHLRSEIIEKQQRPDGRTLTQIRPIYIETNLLPACHSSVLFERGHTQALVACTLGSENDAKQGLGTYEKTPSKERFMLHYNFPPFCVGEAMPMGALSRRELGHGHLAQKALESTLPEQHPVIRLVSEILESNGSSSMASVCAGSLALKAAGIDIRDLVAGVAMGLMVEGDKYAILSDISALEDMQGDMDFKIAGTHQGVLAMQMDTKLSGICLEWLGEILKQAKQARTVILERMQEIAQIMPINTKAMPISESFYIPPSKISALIGTGGKNIKEILQRFAVQIDLDKQSGQVCIHGIQEAVLKAKDFILESLEIPSYVAGEQVQAWVKKVVDFGVFVRLSGGGQALLHKSDLKDLDWQNLKPDTSLTCQVSKIEQGKVHVILT